MKKISHLVLCLFSSLALLSCNNEDAPEAADSPTPDKTLDPNAESTVLTVTGMN